MTCEQFWYDDPNLLEVYQRAYYRKVHEEAHINGYYNFIAMSTAIYNGFRKKGSKAQDYISKPYNVFEKYDKQKRTKKMGGVRQEYRQTLKAQMSWLNSVSNNK